MTHHTTDLIDICLQRFNYSSIPATFIDDIWGLIQYKDAILPVQEIPLWR